MQIIPSARDGEIFEFHDNFGNVRRYRLNIINDHDGGLPWENEDGHGVISGWERRAKRPGEIILNSDRGAHRFYDFQATVKIARRDGWGCVVDTSGMSPRRKAAEAAWEDFDRMRAFCSDMWHYVGVVVTPLTDDPEQDDDIENDYTYALWGVESDCADYIKETALELAGQHANEVATEEAERAYWAARDVVTEG